MVKNNTVLIVEDDVPLNEAYRTIIKSAGYTVWSAENGQEALDVIASEGDPNIIFLDLRMPVMDGIDFLQKYKPVDHPKTTIVVFSNYDEDKEVEKAYDLGADRYILKARATPKELLKIVETTLESQK